MSQPSRNVTDAELAILEFLWSHGEATVREIADALYAGSGNSECATVQKLCERLLAKHCVACDRTARPRTFRASVERSEMIERQLETVADRFCRGSLGSLISHLVDGRKLSRKEIDSLKAQVEELDRGSRRKR